MRTSLPDRENALNKQVASPSKIEDHFEELEVGYDTIEDAPVIPRL